MPFVLVRPEGPLDLYLKMTPAELLGSAPGRIELKCGLSMFVVTAGYHTDLPFNERASRLCPPEIWGSAVIEAETVDAVEAAISKSGELPLELK